MKVGAENRKEVMVLVVLLLLAALALARWVGGWGQPSQPAAAAAPVAQGGQAAAPRRARLQASSPSAVLAPTGDPRLKLDLLRSSEETKYAGNGRNIFRAQAEEIPRIVRPPIAAPQPSPPPGPPQPPPIKLKFFGFASKPGERRRIFLAQGDDVFIAGEGDIIDRRYKVLRIQPNAVDIEDVLNNNRQTIYLTPS